MVQVSLDFDPEVLNKVSDKVPEVKTKALSYTGQSMLNHLMGNSPVDQGLLKSWFIESSTDDEIHIKSPAEYAIYQDQGTKDHMIRPVTKKSLHWGGKPGFHSKGHMVKGIEGKHFVQQSFDDITPELEGFFLRAFYEVLL